ncbi:MAG: DUF4387 family protein [Chitinivibrionales bacterium]|nr:DUF4387 family protein [Chitinivibrionales bacterium]
MSRTERSATPLTRMARVIRSKNAGPYEVTCDIIFKNSRAYKQARRSRAFAKAAIAGLYRVKVSDILSVIWFEPAYALKITMRRWQPSGGPGERDVYGAQQHAPLLGICIGDTL